MTRLLVAIGVTALSLAPAPASVYSVLAGRLPAPRIVLDEATRDKLKTIVFQAAREGDLDTLRAYFQVGLPADGVNARGDTLLTVAAYNGQPKAVELVLAQPGVEVDRRNGMGLTALTAAAFKGDLDALKLLHAAKADVNVANGRGQTALMFASLSGRAKAVEWLLAHGADPKAADKDGKTALSLAETQGAADVAKLLRAALAK